MVFTPIPAGTTAWDTPLNNALQDLQDQIDGKYSSAGGALTGGITTDLAVRSAFFKTTSTTEHAVTIYQAGTSGTDTASALNLISDNPFTSAVQITASENARGSVKITHRNRSGSPTGDANAAAISIDLTQDGAGGTAAQGIFITSTDGGTTGRLITARNGGANLFTVPAVGSVYTATGAFGAQQPVNHAFSAWTYDMVTAVNGSLLTNGTVYLSKVHIPDEVSVTSLYWWVTAVGVTPTAGQNQVGLYNSAGTLLASANVDADISSTGLKTTTIASQGLTAGSFYWVAMVFNAATAPTVARATGQGGLASAVNAGLTAAGYRFATNGVGQTALPGSITPGSNTAAGFAGPWAAVGP